MLSWFVKILGGVVICLSKRRTVEIVKHKVHALRLFTLKVVSDFDVSMNLNFYMGVSLP